MDRYSRTSRLFSLHGRDEHREVFNNHVLPAEHEDGVCEHEDVAAGHQPGVEEYCPGADVPETLAGVG